MSRSFTITDIYNIDSSVAGNGLAGGNGTALSVNTDGSTLEISSDALRVKDLGITTAKLNDLACTTAKIDDLSITTGKIAATAITRAKMAAVGQQVSSSCGAYTLTGSYADVTNLTVTITTTGRPVVLAIQGYDGVSGGQASGIYMPGSGVHVYVKLLRGATQLSVQEYYTGSTAGAGKYPIGFFYLDAVAAGTYTYKVQAYASTGSTNEFDYSVLIAYEL